mmetsp:Transcript_18725/g.38972  ORF Transcript_18725/g.38972 Transcript_18725/m.38972 type:complete len:239 (-) Transcript_18725:53-769(-)
MNLSTRQVAESPISPKYTWDINISWIFVCTSFVSVNPSTPTLSLSRNSLLPMRALTSYIISLASWISISSQPPATLPSTSSSGLVIPYVHPNVVLHKSLDSVAKVFDTSGMQDDINVARLALYIAIPCSVGGYPRPVRTWTWADKCTSIIFCHVCTMSSTSLVSVFLLRRSEFMDWRDLLGRPWFIRRRVEEVIPDAMVAVRGGGLYWGCWGGGGVVDRGRRRMGEGRVMRDGRRRVV